jgi:hypothetical protein
LLKLRVAYLDRNISRANLAVMPAKAAESSFLVSAS